jgi:hypothetical protein
MCEKILLPTKITVNMGKIGHPAMMTDTILNFYFSLILLIHFLCKFEMITSEISLDCHLHFKVTDQLGLKNGNNLLTQHKEEMKAFIGLQGFACAPSHLSGKIGLTSG